MWAQATWPVFLSSTSVTDETQSCMNSGPCLGPDSLTGPTEVMPKMQNSEERI